MIKKEQYLTSLSIGVVDELVAITPDRRKVDGRKIVVEIDPELGVQNAWCAANKEMRYN